ncbi:MAG TPA: hypothetical protein VFC78_19535 [Tepidisphaeraceae bacterium]|nr:hypothetical protein [Tepidisphaeraceae bacterium]
MPLTLIIPPDLEERLALEARRMGISTTDYALQALKRLAPAADRREKLVALLQSWIDAPNVREQKETGGFLVRSLDEDRPSERKLFPPELEGVTW